MVPQSLGEQTERGYYIFFNKLTWAKERVKSSFVLFKDRLLIPY